MEENIFKRLNEIYEEENTGGDNMDIKKKTIHEDLSDMSIEEIMEDGGFSREMATVIYDAEHHINMSEPVEAHKYLANFRRMRDEYNRK